MGSRSRKTFLSVEGIDGSGKTSVAEYLAERIRDRGFDVLVTGEPGGCNLGKILRYVVLENAVMGDIEARAQLMIFLANRAQHVQEVILPALDDGKVVICDRFHDSSVAYQGIGDGLGADRVRAMSTWAAMHLRPKKTLLLDCDAGIALDRIYQKRPFDRMESKPVEYHSRVRWAFVEQAEADPSRYTIIDANAGLNNVLNDSWYAVEHLF